MMALLTTLWYLAMLWLAVLCYLELKAIATLFHVKHQAERAPRDTEETIENEWRRVSQEGPAPSPNNKLWPDWQPGGYQPDRGAGTPSHPPGRE